MKWILMSGICVCFWDWDWLALQIHLPPYLSNEMERNHSVEGVNKSAISLFHPSINHQLSTAPNHYLTITPAYQRILQRKYIWKTLNSSDAKSANSDRWKRMCSGLRTQVYGSDIQNKYLVLKLKTKMKWRKTKSHIYEIDLWRQEIRDKNSFVMELKV